MSRKRRRQAMRERMQETFGAPGDELPLPDRTGRILEALVAFVLGTGFWRLVVSDSWIVSAVFGLLLAALLFSYALLRGRLTDDADGDPPDHR